MRLGEGFDSRNNLIPSSMDRAILALKDLVSMIRDYDSSSIHFVTTGVVREAGNQKGFLDRVKQETGIEARVLNGDEEAELTLAGVRSTLSGFSLPLLVCDIGGGSTEFAMLMENGATRFFSIPMGAIRLTERFQISAPLKKSDEGELNEFIKKNLIEAFNTSERISTFVATAGTPTTLAAIDQALRIYDPLKVHGYRLGFQTLRKIYKLLADNGLKERRKITGLESGREDIIVPGTAIILGLMQILGIKYLTVSEGGLLEGALSQKYKTLTGAYPRIHF